MSDYEYKTYPGGGVQLDGWYTIEQLKQIIASFERMNNASRASLRPSRCLFDGLSAKDRMKPMGLACSCEKCSPFSFGG